MKIDQFLMFSKPLRKFYAIIKRFLIELPREFHPLFERILHNFYENFMQLLRKLQKIFKRFSWISGENFTQFLKKFHAILEII